MMFGVLVDEACQERYFVILSFVTIQVLIVIILKRFYSSRPSKHQKKDKRWKKSREQARLASYPGPYPNTWYALFRSEEIKPGTVRDKYACGIDLVVFRKSDGTAAVLDAHCPHMGAHLGHEGKVVNDCLQCPYHHWKFDNQGKCVDIPYTNKAIPTSATLHAWPVREWGGSIYFYYHENRSLPPWELPDLGEHLRRMKYYHWHELHYDMHVMEMMENCSDPVHFQTVHGKPSIPILNRFVYLVHNITCESNGPLITFINKPLAYWNSGKPTPLSDFAAVYTTFVGPSIVVFNFVTKYWGDALFVKSSLPVGPLSQHIVDVVYAEPKMPGFIIKFLKHQSINGFEEDKPIWEHKIGRSKPLLVSGDGKIMARRAWYRQFYDNSSW